ncbi:hypothetical protein [Salininema proteolyticum]|uniref:Uncharacterized protein n=1 Tax=Salininema proteolyticum TaxID=1607685 RepID=A0ABV8TZ79_9ACTN
MKDDKGFEEFRRTADYRNMVGGMRLVLLAPLLIAVMFVLWLLVDDWVPTAFFAVLLVVLAVILLIPLVLLYLAAKRIIESSSRPAETRDNVSRLLKSLYRDSRNLKDFPLTEWRDRR